MKRSAKKPSGPRKKPNQRRSQQTVEYMIEATAHIIEKLGIKKTSTNKIAEKAGVSIGSLYQYFPNKNSLIEKALAVFIEKNVVKLLVVLRKRDTKSLELLIDEIIDVFFDFFVAKQGLRKELFRNASEELLSNIYAAEDHIQKEIKQSLLFYRPKSSDDEVEMISYIMVQSVVGCLRGSFSENRKIDFPKLKKELTLIIKSYLKHKEF